jgi:trimeric autotransporter adhesin
MSRFRSAPAGTIVIASLAFLLLHGCGRGGTESTPQAGTSSPPTFSTPIFEAYVKASNPGGGRFNIIDAVHGDRFGHALALGDGILAVGAPLEDSCATGVNGDQAYDLCPDIGAVYVFTNPGGTWAQQAYLKPHHSVPQVSAPYPGAQFGQALALSGDTLAIGASTEPGCRPGSESEGGICPGAGAVYIFTRSGGVWRQQAYLRPAQTELYGAFGGSVALEGNTLVVGAPGESSCATSLNGDQTDTGCAGAGAVYVFTRIGGVWTEQAHLKSSDTQALGIGIADSFGSSVALSGETLVVGVPYEDSCASGINGDHTNKDCADAGAVYVFMRDDGAWTQQAYVKASHTARGDTFGSALALLDDTLVVSARREDSCATGVDGDQTNTGCAQAGAVYVFSRAGATWRQESYLKASNTGANDAFGSSVALTMNTLAVGAINEASCAMGLGGDPDGNGCREAVYLYTRQAGSWRPTTYLKAPYTGAADQFGFALAVSGSTLAVGAPGESSCAAGINGDDTNNGCPGAGAVYLYRAQ